jgi:hypothetical protein
VLDCSDPKYTQPTYKIVRTLLTTALGLFKRTKAMSTKRAFFDRFSKGKKKDHTTETKSLAPPPSPHGTDPTPGATPPPPASQDYAMTISSVTTSTSELPPGTTNPTTTPPAEHNLGNAAPPVATIANDLARPVSSQSDRVAGAAAVGDESLGNWH